MPPSQPSAREFTVFENGILERLDTHEQRDDERFAEGTASVNRLFWKIFALLALPILGFAAGYGGLQAQVSFNKEQLAKVNSVLESSVLTVKDKDNLQLQITAMQSDIKEIKAAVKR